MSSFSSTVLVTGGCGFIGSNFVNYLLSQQGVEKVINYDNLSQGSNRLNVEASERCIFVCGDVSNGDLLGRTLHLYGVDRVVHFAALTHVGNSFKDPGEFVQNNVQGTLSLLESVRKYSHIKLLLYISTDEVYGESGDEEGPKRETDSLHPTNPYSASKLAAEKLIEVYLKAYKIPSCIVRMCNVFGPRQGLDKMFPKFIRQAASDEPFTIEGDGSQLRSWMYVLDACEAIHTVFQQGGVGSVYNIGSTCEVSVLEAAMAIKKEVFAQGSYMHQSLKVVTPKVSIVHLLPLRRGQPLYRGQRQPLYRGHCLLYIQWYSAHSKPLKMFGHTFKSINLHNYVAASINLVGQREKLTGQIPKLAGKCPVTDSYYEHWW